MVIQFIVKDSLMSPGSLRIVILRGDGTVKKNPALIKAGFYGILKCSFR
jgi:hypothetical protein